MKAICYTTTESEQFVKTECDWEKGAGNQMQLIKVYTEEKRQEMLGFGGAFTEAAAYTVSKMSSDNQKKVTELYFGESGNCYNFCRTHIQSCDFSLGNYAYVEDADDKGLETFRVDKDKEYIIPFIHMAQEKNPDIRFLASPWSPPAFMKSNGEMNNGGKLKKEYYAMWADMMARYIKEYDALGIPVERITVQNEPQAVQTWDSCVYTGEEEGEFAVNYLRPALRKAGYGDVVIGIWDHNKDIIVEQIKKTFRIPGAKEEIGAIAFHWYSGDHFEALSMVREKYPDKELIFTEGCVEYSRFGGNNPVKNAEMYAHDMIGNFNSGTNAFIDWNLVLDDKGGPNHVGNLCDAPVMYQEDTDTLDVKLSYHYIGHFSRFVRRGAKRMVVSRYTDKLESTAFENPDGSKVVIVLNRSDEDVMFCLQAGEYGQDTSSKAHSIMTFVWQ